MKDFNFSIHELKKRSCWIFDLDGVIYAGSALLPGVLDVLEFLRKRKCNIAFITNNSVRTKLGVFHKLDGLGVRCTPDDVITSGEATALYLRSNLDNGAKVCVVGAEDLSHMITHAGMRIVEYSECDVLVAGFHPKLSYEMITSGMRALLRGVPFIACNLDANFPGENGELQPGCGAVIGALSGASLRKPDVVVGKPNVLMLELLLKRHGWKSEDCVVVGDTLDSDIRMAMTAGIPSIWVSSGMERNSVCSDLVPTLTVQSLSELVAVL